MKDEKRSRKPSVPAEAGTEKTADKLPGKAGEDGKAAEVRDFAAEVAELIREFPEAGNGGKLPDEVVEAVIRAGKTVLEAYREYALAHAGEEKPAETGKKAGSGAKNAPVRGVSGGWPVEGQAKDAFMSGFESEA